MSAVAINSQKYVPSEADRAQLFWYRPAMTFCAERALHASHAEPVPESNGCNNAIQLSEDDPTTCAFLGTAERTFLTSLLRLHVLR